MKLVILLLMIALNSHASGENPDVPAPGSLTLKYMKEISKRYPGQKRFAVEDYGEEEQQEGQGQQQDRDIQESDVFKLGHEGKKELFLLNNNRGFQVISFSEGLERPRIVSRLPVYNNWASEMYFLKEKNQVIILNTEWSYSATRWGSHYETEFYLVDVSNTSDPKVIKQTSIPGYLSESRMVGDVLYALTTNGEWSQRKAMISSLKVGQGTFQHMDKEELHSARGWVNTMNVVKEGERYYVLSTLTGTNNKGAFVNVHDITSPAGSIDKVFTAHARGRIEERSETFLYKNHLFAVSNFSEGNSPDKISVEAYPLARTSSLVVSKENMRATVGDTNGLDASLQDVRVSGGLLYTFWVPSNNVDPFELFDISDPSKGIKHLGRLEFDGWISKAFPIEKDNRRFVLGLGWIVPADSSSDKRYPQAKLFEIKNDNGTYKHEVISSLTLDSHDVWANLNDLDKNFEIVQDSPGIYNILFPVYFTKNWKQGAKVVNANINSGKLSEGASIVANQSWLKRIFVNPEVRAINGFSDMELETYNQDQIGKPGIAKAISILELARRIVDFIPLSDGEGLQLVDGAKNVELRRVSTENIDAEKSDILGNKLIPGDYKWHTIKGGKLYVISAFYQKEDHGNYEYDKFDYANMNVVNLSDLSVSSQKLSIKTMGWPYEIEASTSQFDAVRFDENFILIGQEGFREAPVEASCRYFFEEEDEELQLSVVGNEVFAYNRFSYEVEDEYFSLPLIKKLNFEGDTVTCGSSISVPGKPSWKKDNFLVTQAAESYRDWCVEIDYDYEDWAEEYEYDETDRTFSLKLLSEKEAQLVDMIEESPMALLSSSGPVSLDSKSSRIDFWDLTAKGHFTTISQYLNYPRANEKSLVSVKTLNDREFVFIKNQKKLDLYELLDRRLSKVNITSTFDGDQGDGSAEYIYEIDSLKANNDLSRIHVSQGYHGLAEIILE